MLGLLMLATGAFGQGDPGHVTARRLNRAEYTNTIRDLLAVDFRAEKNFPTDDSGQRLRQHRRRAHDFAGADGEVPGGGGEHRLARWAPTRCRPSRSKSNWRHARPHRRRLDRTRSKAQRAWISTAMYTIRFGLPGERAADAKPVTLGFWMDGKLLHSPARGNQALQAGLFRPLLRRDDAARTSPPATTCFAPASSTTISRPPWTPRICTTARRTSFSIPSRFIGPFPSKVERASRKKILICDPNSGPACVNRILATLARRAYRRPVTRGRGGGARKIRG